MAISLGVMLAGSAGSSVAAGTTITVNTLADTSDGSITDGSISLRDAIALSPADSTIDFSVTGTISLALGQLVVQDRIIHGPGAASLTIDAHGASRVFSTSGTTSLSGMTITGGNGGELGGGISNSPDSHLTVADSVVTGNRALRGGGISGSPELDADSSVTVVDSTVSNNTAVSAGGDTGAGGGLYGGFTPLIVDRSTISDNNAGTVGGGIYGGAQLTNSTVSGNFAVTLHGGGAYLPGNSRVVNSTFSDNHRGGVLTSGVVANSTIVGNHLGYGVTGGATVLNSIAYHNTAMDGKTPGDLGAVDTDASRNNLIASAVGAGGLTDGVNGNIVGVADPGLGALADNGGPTKTYALFSFSPAVNAGDNSLVPDDPATGLPFTTDQTGAARRFGGGTVDMGAVELQGTQTSSTIVNTATDDVAGNDLTSLREAIGFANRSGGTVTFDPTVFATPKTIALAHGLMTLDGVTIAGPGAGSATVDGGGTQQVFESGGVSRISGLTVTGGVRDVGDGAIDNSSGSTLTIRACVISGNAASGISNQGTLVVSDSTIANNTTSGPGGGVWAVEGVDAVTTIVNSTISANSAGAGGGIFAKGTVTVRNSTISANSAGAGGGGGISGSPAIFNSIVAGNLHGPRPDDVGAADPASSYNLVGVAVVGGGLTNGVNGNIVGVDPQLGPLADNGAPTKTHALLPGSPAINAGDPAFDPNAFTPPLTTDQRGAGFDRVRGGRLDIGAFEVQNPPQDLAPPVITVAAGVNDAVAGSGWYNRASSGTDGVEVDVNASDSSGVTHLHCTDGQTSPLDVSAGTGLFTLTDGMHSISCTATDGKGNTGAGDGSTVMPVAFKVDETAPTVTCQSPAPQFLVGATGSVSAAVTDATSGPAATPVSAAADTSSAGPKTVSLIGSDKAGNSTTVSCAYTVVTGVYSFGGFASPVPKSTMTYNAGSNIPVKFVLTNASGQPIPAGTASALASGGNVKATLSGPNSSTVLASALCSWNATGHYFQCNIKTPSGLKTGKNNAYLITVLENVGSGFVTAPPYTNTAADANPETIYFK